MIEIKIPFKTPTCNHLYWHRGNMKIMKTEAKELREEIKQIVYKSLPFVCVNLNDGVKVEVEIHENWFTKKGDVARKDIANREKFLIDSIFKALNIDDKFIFNHNFLKVQDEKEFALIKIGGMKMANRGFSKEKIKKEIDKCVVLCKNCHARVHYKER